MEKLAIIPGSAVGKEFGQPGRVSGPQQASVTLGAKLSYNCQQHKKPQVEKEHDRQARGYSEEKLLMSDTGMRNDFSSHSMSS